MALFAKLDRGLSATTLLNPSDLSMVFVHLKDEAPKMFKPLNDVTHNAGPWRQLIDSLANVAQSLAQPTDTPLSIPCVVDHGINMIKVVLMPLTTNPTPNIATSVGRMIATTSLALNQIESHAKFKCPAPRIKRKGKRRAKIAYVQMNVWEMLPSKFLLITNLVSS